MRLTLLFLLFFFWHGQAYAGIVKLLKKRKVAVIDDGDVSKGDKVCFYSVSGRKRACGRVVKVKEDKSYVKVKSRKRFRRLKKGMSHEVDETGSDSRARSDMGFALRLLFTPGLMGRSGFSYLAFEDSGKREPFVPFDKDRIADQDSGESKMARLFPWGSGGLEGELYLNNNMSITMGGRFTLINVSPRVASDFLGKNAKNESSAEYLSIKYGGHELNFWLDFFALHIDNLGLRLGLGTEFTMSTVTIDAEMVRDVFQKDSENRIIKASRDGRSYPVVDKVEVVEGDMLKGKSTANIISARLSARKDFAMGVYGFGLGISAIISPATITSSFTLDDTPRKEILDHSAFDGDKQRLTDNIEKALEHEHNIFSIVLAASIYLGI